ncbi:MAG: low specificity L-threonine aldolase [Oscillospiraceae bacterium]|nr:low specificity L-threonine aldolase [Oscillospiraceae bacterium]
MIYFHNDYAEGCHESILQRLVQTNLEQTPGYGTDPYCAAAAERIRVLCEDPSLSVHFLVGGTQTNMTVIAAALRAYQGVVCAQTGHIHVHETGAVEATGHKVLALPSADGKITAEQVRALVEEHRASEAMEHTVQPKMVYISNPTELGTIYSRKELEALSEYCRDNGLYLFLDGARLGYGLEAADNDLTLKDLARLCDVFYIGGTKQGALFGEAVVFSHPALAEDFRYMIKQHGGMLAKGRLLGLQFDALLRDGLYFRMARQANEKADQIRAVLGKLGYPLYVPGSTNQIFVTMPDAVLDELAKSFTFSHECRVDDRHRAVRFCTSWATSQENVDRLCDALRQISKEKKDL